MSHAKGHQLMRINLLATIVAGILQGGDSRISQIAQSINEGRRKHDSVKKQVSRFVKNDHISHDEHYLPFVNNLLEVLSQTGELVFAIDGSKVGSGCMALMFSVIYKNRAIPIIWHVYRRKKGHFAEQVHIDLLNDLKALVPQGCRVCIVGDGEFDGCDWQAGIVASGWDYVLRTARNTLLENNYGDQYQPCGVLTDQGEDYFEEGLIMGKNRYGPVNLYITHGYGHELPLILTTNLDYGQIIKQFYIKRFLIETFFRDSKSKGFNLQKSGLRCPKKIARLMIANCIAYVLCILAGIKSYKSKFYDLVAEADQKALSLFQIGLRFIRKLVDLRQWRAFSWSYDLALSINQS